MGFCKEKKESNYKFRKKVKPTMFTLVLLLSLPGAYIYFDFTKYSALGHLNSTIEFIIIILYVLIFFFSLIKRKWHYLFFLVLSVTMVVIYPYSGLKDLIIHKGFYTLRGQFYKNLSHCALEHYGKNQEQTLAYCFRTYPEIEGGNYDVFYDTGGELMLPEDSRSCSWYKAWYSIAREKNDSILYGVAKEISMPSILFKTSDVGHSFYAVEYDLFDKNFNYYPSYHCAIK
ncbi:hypothetical protein [Pantoea ananatis]|uniref:hypothetical protein n=2 Tax=Pantoea ananas TaxID=553 RepID=UPI0023B1B8C4|nr:hypothetical protein [Pantoea ananatis]